jgi:hypothetical protein
MDEELLRLVDPEEPKDPSDLLPAPASIARC